MTGAAIPHDLELEQRVLGAMLLGGNGLRRGLSALDAEDFYSETHRELFRALDEAATENTDPDPVALADGLGGLSSGEARRFVTSLADAYYPAVNLERHAETLRSYAFRRSLIGLAGRVEQMARTKSEEAALAAEEELHQRATRTRVGEDLYTFETGKDAFSRRVLLRKAGETVMGVPSGIGKLDRSLTGFHDGDLVILGGRPGMSKTVVMWQAAITAGRHGKRAFVMNLEMAYERIQERCACAVSGISYEDWRRGTFTHEDANKLLEGYEHLSGLPVYMHNPQLGRSVADLKRAVRALKPDVVFVDYLQLLAMERGVDLYTAVTLVSAELKQLAVSEGIPVVCAAQLSRNVEERFDKRPLLSDLRQSGQIEQDADVVIMLYRDAYYYPEGVRSEAGKNGPEPVLNFHPQRIEFIARKDREGGNWATSAYFRGESMWIEDHPIGSPARPPGSERRATA